MVDTSSVKLRRLCSLGAETGWMESAPDGEDSILCRWASLFVEGSGASLFSPRGLSHLARSCGHDQAGQQTERRAKADPHRQIAGRHAECRTDP